MAATPGIFTGIPDRAHVSVTAANGDVFRGSLRSNTGHGAQLRLDAEPGTHLSLLDDKALAVGVGRIRITGVVVIPDPLPTAPGIYEAPQCPLAEGCEPYLLARNGAWFEIDTFDGNTIAVGSIDLEFSEGPLIPLVLFSTP